MQGDVVYRHEWRAMGVWCRVASTHPLDGGAIEAQVEAWEQVLSRFRPQSELMRLNRSRQLRVSKTLQQVVLASLDMARWSNGLVVPSLGRVMTDLGYNRTFAELGQVVNDDFVSAQVVPQWQDIVVKGRDIRLPADLWLDVAGVAKGWVAAQLVTMLATSGAAVLAEIGGDVAVSTPDTAPPWAITVENPFVDGAVLATVMLQKGAVATSSTHKRTWRRAGQRMHHIVDPRTGMPAVSDVVTATVIANEGITAETAAKVVVLRGSQAGLHWLAEQQLPGLVVTADQQVWTSPRWSEFVWSPAAEY